VRVTLGVLLLLVGCHEVGQTGRRGIRGVLLDADDAPIARQRVVSEDHGAMTDENGRFEVRWKDPTTFVDMRRGGVTWRRTWQPDVDRGVVPVKLPPVREGEVVCRTEIECMAEVTWTFPEGLKAFTTVQCGERTPASVLPQMPAGVPVVRCSTILGELVLDVADRQGRVMIKSRPAPQAVNITGVESPSECSVGVFDGEVVTGIGETGLRVRRDTYAWSICGGRVGPPVQVRPRDRSSSHDGAVVLAGALEGVDLALTPPLPAPATLHLVRRARDGSIDWEQRVAPTGEGLYRLPPLPRGDYRLGWGASDVLATVNPPEPEIPGTVVIVARAGEWGEVGGYVGSLRLEEDTPRGALRVDGHPPEVYRGGP
jgi:hypothetical protein